MSPFYSQWRNMASWKQNILWLKQVFNWCQNDESNVTVLQSFIFELCKMNCSLDFFCLGLLTVKLSYLSVLMVALDVLNPYQKWWLWKYSWNYICLVCLALCTANTLKEWGINWTILLEVNAPGFCSEGCKEYEAFCFVSQA